MEIKKADCQSEFFGLMQLRKDVFVHEQQVDIDLEMDEQDLNAWHFVALDAEKVIATCRLILIDDYAKLGRMAVLPTYRHKQVGSQLITYAEKTARSYKIRKLVMEAQVQAIPFYLSNGYRVVADEIIMDANIEHKLMEKLL